MSQSLGTNSADAGLVAVSRTETVAETTQVRHFDQLDDRTQMLLLDALDGRHVSFEETDLTPGDVVVYTEYLRIGR